MFFRSVASRSVPPRYNGRPVPRPCNDPIMWAGHFLSGTKVLHIHGSQVEIRFSSPITEIGFPAQLGIYRDTDWTGSHKYTITAYNGEVSLGSVEYYNDDPNVSFSSHSADGRAPFIGVRAICGTQSLRSRSLAGTTAASDLRLALSILAHIRCQCPTYLHIKLCAAEWLTR